MKNSKSDGEIKTKNKTWLAVYSIVGLILVVGVVLFLSQGKTDKDSFPELTLESGATFKGQFSDPGGYWQYNVDDDCTYDSLLDQTTLSEGQYYYYATEDLTVQQIKDRVNCLPFNKIRIMYLDPISQTFYSWPQAVHNETETLADPSSIMVKANTTFIIQSKDETLMGEIYKVNVPTPYATMSLPTNVFDPGGYYGYVNDMTSGWVSLAGLSDGTEMTTELNSSVIANRVEKLFYKNGADINDFGEVTVTAGTPVPDIDFSAGEYMIWMRLGEVPALIEPPQGDPCGGEDSSHACITDGDLSGDGNVLADRNSGDLACSNVLSQTCLSIEKNCDVKNNENNGWQADANSCSSAFLIEPISCWYRAVCGEEQQPQDCQGSDSNHVCITDSSNPAAFIQTGDEACANCLSIEASCHNVNGGDPNWISTGESCSAQGQDFLHMGMAITNNCAFRAVCGLELAPYDPNQDYLCGGDDASHVCLTDDGSAYNNDFPDNEIDGRGKIEYFSGEAACQTELGLSCLDIEANCKATLDTSTFTDDGTYNGDWDEDFSLLNNNQEIFDATDYSCQNTFESHLEYAPCKWRAVCGEQTSTIDLNFGLECGGGDDDHVCLTDSDPSGSGNVIEGISSGNDACNTYRGKVCDDVQLYCSNAIWRSGKPSTFCNTPFPPVDQDPNISGEHSSFVGGGLNVERAYNKLPGDCESTQNMV